MTGAVQLWLSQIVYLGKSLSGVLSLSYRPGLRLLVSYLKLLPSSAGYLLSDSLIAFLVLSAADNAPCLDHRGNQSYSIGLVHPIGLPLEQRGQALRE